MDEVTLRSHQHLAERQSSYSETFYLREMNGYLNGYFGSEELKDHSPVHAQQFTRFVGTFSFHIKNSCFTYIGILEK